MRKLPLDVIAFTDPNSIIAEQYRTARTNIEALREQNKLKTLFLTSANSGEGKTTTALNLAVIFARSGKKVLLVDCDLRKHSLTDNFHLTNSIGLVGVIEERCNLSDAIFETNASNLYVLPSGRSVKNPAELLLNVQLDGTIEQMKTEFDLILFDTPPVEEVTDALILSQKLDGSILIVRENYSKKDAVKRAKDALDNMKANCLGLIHNDIAMSKIGRYQYGYGIKRKGLFGFGG